MWWDSCVYTTADGTTTDVLTIACIPYLINNLINVALIFAGIVALAFIIWGGFKIARSAGDAKQMEGARNTIVYAVIGLILVFFSLFIVRLISYVTGVECINMIGFSNCLDTANCGYKGEAVCSDSNGTYCWDTNGNRRPAGSGATCEATNTATR